MRKGIMNKFKKEINLGLVFPDDPYLLNKNKNPIFTDIIVNQLNLAHLMG